MEVYLQEILIKLQSSVLYCALQTITVALQN